MTPFYESNAPWSTEGITLFSRGLLNKVIFEILDHLKIVAAVEFATAIALG